MGYLWSTARTYTLIYSKRFGNRLFIKCPGFWRIIKDNDEYSVEHGRLIVSSIRWILVISIVFSVIEYNDSVLESKVQTVIINNQCFIHSWLYGKSFQDDMQ